MGPMELQLTKRAFEIHSRLRATSGPELLHENNRLKAHIEQQDAVHQMAMEQLKESQKELINQLNQKIEELQIKLLSFSLLDCNNPVTKILNFVCNAENISKEDILADRRSSKKVYARHIVYYLCCKLTSQSLPSIGRIIRKDHTTIMHGRNKIARMIETNPELKAKIESYSRILVFGDGPCPA